MFGNMFNAKSFRNGIQGLNLKMKHLIALMVSPLTIKAASKDPIFSL